MIGAGAVFVIVVAMLLMVALLVGAAWLLIKLLDDEGIDVGFMALFFFILPVVGVSFAGLFNLVGALL